MNGRDFQKKNWNIKSRNFYSQKNLDAKCKIFTKQVNIENEKNTISLCF